MGSPFEISREQREQHLKERPAPPPEPADQDQGAGLLPAPKPKRKQCSLYLDVDMMARVKRVAKQRDVTIGAVIEACVKMALEQLEQ